MGRKQRGADEDDQQNATTHFPREPSKGLAIIPGDHVVTLNFRFPLSILILFRHSREGRKGLCRRPPFPAPWRLCAFALKNVHDLPHPGLLPKEKENRSLRPGKSGRGIGRTPIRKPESVTAKILSWGRGHR